VHGTARAHGVPPATILGNFVIHHRPISPSYHPLFESLRATRPEQNLAVGTHNRRCASDPFILSSTKYTVHCGPVLLLAYVRIHRYRSPVQIHGSRTP